MRLGFDHLLQLLLREMCVGRKQQNGADLHDEQAAKAENQEDHEMGPGPGNAQILGQKRGCFERRRGGRIGDRIAAERWRERLGGERPRRIAVRELRVEIWLARLQWIVVDEAHRRVLGQPAANAAATSGKSSSWWPVMA
ncbi:MAG: hypothetical protein DMG55_16000 [Acidobacteria bacterium]|nr:MAG: hypothetical protein DMG55_16000 [Acidobacteriota bacterium]